MVDINYANAIMVEWIKMTMSGNARKYSVKSLGMIRLLNWLLEYQYSVFAEDNTPRWEPYIVTADQALAAMAEWEQTREEMAACM